MPLFDFDSFAPDPESKQAMMQGLLSAGLGMLANNQGGRSFGQVLGAGGLQGLQAYQQHQQNALRNKLINAQIAETTAQAEQRKAQVEEAKRQQEMMRRLGGQPQVMPSDVGPTQPVSSAGLFDDLVEHPVVGSQARTYRELAGMSGFPSLKEMFDAKEKLLSQAEGAVNKPFYSAGGKIVPNLPYQDYEKAARAAGKTDVSVKIDNKTGESLAKPIGDMIRDSRDAALGAMDTKDTIKRVKGAIQNGNVTLGPGATIRNRIDQVSQMLGSGGATTEERLVNTRNTIRGLAQFTVAARKQLKGQGQITDQEQKLLGRAESGEIDDFTLPELQSLVDVSERLADKTIKLHQSNLGAVKMHKDEGVRGLSSFYELPEVTSEPPKSMQPRVRRYNPKTGKIE